MSILDSINQPADLRALKTGQLSQLAVEIRERLIATVTANGGHLASNLGVVEITLALHSIFDSPRDKIVWDVGHQSYVHKFITGRRDRFSTIRQYKGLSGFPEPGESPHDVFGTGHASTSISAGLGMAIARDLAAEDYHVVTVIGDGALTGGMAWEALNQAGHLGTRLIVLLNDNAMSISPNVGAMARLLQRIRSYPHYRRAKTGAENLIARLPGGSKLWQAVRWTKEVFKGLLIPSLFWRELGFTYIGPIDGHNLKDLRQALSLAKNYSPRPTIVHVLTQKGKGHPPAEDDATKFHGLAPSGEKKEAPAYSEVFGRSLLCLFEAEPRLVAITAAMKEGTGLAPVAQRFPHRVFDVGICEQHAVTFAAGLATQGFIPIVAIYSTFLQRAFDQVLHDVCIQNLHVIFALDRGGIVGDDGKTHQGIFDLSYLGLMPNMCLAAPKDENELRHLLYTAIKNPGPMAIRYPRGGGLGVSLDEEWRELPLGRGEVVREGGEVVLLALGATVAPALEAAERLAGVGVGAGVVNLRFAKPLDTELILSLADRTGRLVTVEENALAGGVGSAVLGLLETHGASARVVRLGLPDEFIEHGPQGLLRSRYSLDEEGIARQVLAAFPELVPLRVG